MWIKINKLNKCYSQTLNIEKPRFKKGEKESKNKKEIFDKEKQSNLIRFHILIPNFSFYLVWGNIKYVRFHRERKDNGFFNTLVPKVFKIKFSYICWLNNFKDFSEFWLVDSLSWVFQPLILIYRRGNFVYHYLGCILIYRPLSYPFRCLNCCKFDIYNAKLST